MNFLPHDNETFVVSKSSEEVQFLLAYATITENLVHNKQEHNEKMFVGHVHETAFQISIRPKRPNSFLPVMKGEIESTSTGSILFISYQLFPSSKLYLSFWSLFIIITGIVGWFRFPSYFAPITTIFVVGIIHYIAWANFRMQVRISREILLKSLAQ